ncbi:histone-like nucleoid-structuring protein Lsr2 [Actinokineospora spheciospongiae]|uniref:histone-like nucleoid-structuring protein Lsr2 n=2 Tax=Actinokineospora spheciospongiae TaxID=909613 RepID=UPI000D717C7B|nr:Lsr2 family protein [Actinokineospora spheciospongiae]PWW54857.1 Lsr2 protein [Actinokineospora spheciospongiae]
MAQKTIVQLFDDLDGSTGDDIRSVEFSLDGVRYEIDLNESNASRLRDELAEFIEAARRTGGRVKRSAAASSPVKAAGEGRSKEQTKAIRDWARQNGHEISERGRIPSAVVEAFEEAHAAKPKGGGGKAKKAAFSG